MPTPQPGAAQAVGGPLDLAWDAEARRRAKQNAQRLAKHDPEGAAALLVQLAAAEAEATQQQVEHGGFRPSGVPSSAYNPLRYYAAAAKRFGWTVAQCNQTHFPAFFGLMREVGVLDDEERQANEDAINESRGAGGAAGPSGGIGVTEASELAAYPANFLPKVQ